MKKLVLLIVIILFNSAYCLAQPNGGFENWEPYYTSESPVGWQTLNFLIATFPPNPVSAFKASGIDKHSGSYALKLKTIYVSNNPAPDIIDDTVGAVFTGFINISPASYKYGFPYFSRPEKLTLWYKYLPVGDDVAGARVLLTKWNGVKTDTIAFGETDIYENSFYSLFEMNLTYYSDEIPDTAAIFLGSSAHQSPARVGSTFYVDDVAFTGWVGVEENAKTTTWVSVYPNPVKENVTFSIQDKEACSIEIIDIYGKRLGQYKLKDSVVNIDAGIWTNGIYLYSILDKKNKTLNKGKFNVIK